jgi:hypothetical protein
METTSKYSDEPFAVALGKILQDRYVDQFGRFSFTAFLRAVGGLTPEGLRLQIIGDRTLQPETMIRVATVLGIPPEFFLEYRVWWVGDFLERRPELATQVYEYCRSLHDEIE